MKKIFPLSLLILFQISMSCSNGDDGTTPDPITSSNILGSVVLYDSGTSLLDNAGMTVTVENATPTKSAITDSGGNFIINDVAFGTYNLTYTKTGYGTFKIFDLAHNNPVDTNISESPSLGQVSTTEITDLSVNVSADNVIIEVSTSPASNNSNPVYIRAFYHTDASVSNTVFTSFSEVLEARIDPNQFTISAAELISLGFQSGTNVYVKVYGDSFFSNDYEDTDVGRRIFPNLNTVSADAVTFTVP
ncbi:carboxypeptidase-like regulatory domain-containing protein [Muricauda sp. SCSIO 64092]|uniref:carboxypeptidase-like regulatory domain-containing protein n=1 Tax=Allomuricauda sp. SCSIO 64092 TaxID=2908842 RepID=UPI001FF13A31|nr:carboxypeptidase-like regulatory domain-containing protein [Muricauda sp. SCSIO 64092]UOY09164.1 carboxypeptidase-like regulatory domain-containing protein [Muricauda sp. SCSIO 64092]